MDSNFVRIHLFIGCVLIFVGLLYAGLVHDHLVYGTGISCFGLSLMLSTVLVTLIEYICCSHKQNNNIIILHQMDINSLLNNTIVKNQTCSICLESINETFKHKCCNHYSHQKCIQKWYQQNSHSSKCFICKKNLDQIMCIN